MGTLLPADSATMPTARHSACVKSTLPDTNSCGSCGRLTPAKWNTKSTPSNMAGNWATSSLRVKHTTCTSLRSAKCNCRFLPTKPLTPVIRTFMGSILCQSVFATRNALHKVKFEQQRLHACHIEPGGVVRVIVFTMRALGHALLALFHKFGIVQVARI